MYIGTTLAFSTEGSNLSLPDKLESFFGVKITYKMGTRKLVKNGIQVLMCKSTSSKYNKKKTE